MNEPNPGLDRLSPADGNPPELMTFQNNQAISLQELPPEQALELLVKNPVEFVQTLIRNAAQVHLSDLREEAELRGALNLFRKAHPEFTRFEPFIMQEIVYLLQSDPDGGIEPWDVLLEKGLQTFREKFVQTVQESQAAGKEPSAEPPYMETATNRVAPDMPQNFTREQISKMSMRDFLKNESAINAALKEKRIR